LHLSFSLLYVFLAHGCACGFVVSHGFGQRPTSIKKQPAAWERTVGFWQKVILLLCLLTFPPAVPVMADSDKTPHQQ